MVQSSKWIEGIEPEHLLTSVARRALQQRLKTVWDYASLAAKKQSKDIEFVHQLRVATRRARAALQIFADLLPEREARWMKKTLRSLRQAAGNARDLDVLAERLAGIAKEEKGNSLSGVIEKVAKHRRRAQKPLVAAYKRAKSKRFKERSRALRKAIAWQSESPEPTFAEAARTTLGPFVHEFVLAARADLSEVEALHRMRIAGKHVRYAAELFAGAFDKSFRRDLYPTFEEVQEKLGIINDHATAIALFHQWLERAEASSSQAVLKELISAEETQLDAECQAFRQWWTPQRQSALAKQFENVLEMKISLAADPASRQGRTPDARTEVGPVAPAAEVAADQC